MLAPIPAHAAAHGFVPGRGPLTGAACHAGSAVVLALDLRSFFATVHAGRVYGVARVVGYPEAVAHLLTALCTVATPIAVLSAMPPGGPPEGRYALRQALTGAHLPQGAPSSPHLANLSAHRLDRRLSSYAGSVDAVYTRYADDLTFSGGTELDRRVPFVLGGLRRIVHDEGFRLNEAKTRVQRRSGRQRVTGLVVNDPPAVGRREYDALRALLHNAVRTGGAEQNRRGHPDFRAHVLGRIGWVGSVDPTRGRRLRAAFDRVDWG